MARISSRERWLLGAGAAAAALALGYLFVLEPALARRREAAELIPARESTLERRRALVGRRDALTAEANEISKQIEAQSKRFLSGPTPPLAASELQRMVKDLAVAAGVEVRSERVLAPSEREGLQEIPIEITVAGGIREAMTFLYQLDRTPKLLTVQDLKMRVTSPGLPVPQARDILTTLTLAGYLLAATPPPKPGERPPVSAPGPPKG